MNWKPSSRRDNLLALSGNWYNAYQIDSNSFYALMDRDDDAAIYLVTISPTGTLTKTGVRDGLTPGLMMEWCRIGGDVYYSNGVQRGILKELTSRPWPTEEFPFDDDIAVWKPLPVPKFFDIFAGRLICAVGNILYWSEKNNFSIYNAVRSYRRLDSNIRMVCAVGGDGVYISDERNIYFMPGKDPYQWNQENPSLTYLEVDYPQ